MDTEINKLERDQTSRHSHCVRLNYPAGECEIENHLPDFFGLLKGILGYRGNLALEKTALKSGTSVKCQSEI